MISVKTLYCQLSLILILLPVFCHAQEFNPYAFAFGGYSNVEDFDASRPGGAGTFDFDVDGGWTLGGGLGVRSDCFGGSRFEIEGLITEAKLDKAMLSMPTPPPPMVPQPMDPNCDDDFCEFETSSDVKIKAAMVNFLKEIPCGCVTGYVGGGVGVASFGLDTQLGQINFFDCDTAFAWQLIAGVDVPITQCITLFTQYRLLSISEVDLNSMGVAFTTDQTYSHSVNVGARYFF